VHHLYLSLGGTQTMGGVGATVVRLVLTALVIGPAAVLMGGTLPAAARAVVQEADRTRRSLALLYSLNTVGAVFGALVGPLLLFGLLGNKLTIWGTVCINALVGLAARALGRGGSTVNVAVAEADGAGPSSAPSANPEVEARLAYLAAGVVGFVFLGLELVWYRILTPLLGGSSLTFGLILACALAGIGIGGYLFSKRDAQKPITLQLLGVTLGLEAVCALLPFAWGDYLALVAAHLRPMLNLGFGYLVSGWVFVAAAVVLPASIVSGYQFPALMPCSVAGAATWACRSGVPTPTTQWGRCPVLCWSVWCSYRASERSRCGAAWPSCSRCWVVLARLTLWCVAPRSSRRSPPSR
jgi:hypothetical protein